MLDSHYGINILNMAEMADMLQTTVWDPIAWNKMSVFWFMLHRTLFNAVFMKISHESDR